MCDNPEVVVYDGVINPIPHGPATCATCGGDLELICKSQRHPAPLGENNRVRIRGLAPHGRSYKPKPCMRCLRTFQPSGPHSLYCTRDDCESVAASLTSHLR